MLDNSLCHYKSVTFAHSLSSLTPTGSGLAAKLRQRVGKWEQSHRPGRAREAGWITPFVWRPDLSTLPMGFLSAAAEKHLQEGDGDITTTSCNSVTRLCCPCTTLDYLPAFSTILTPLFCFCTALDLLSKALSRWERAYFKCLSPSVTIAAPHRVSSVKTQVGFCQGQNEFVGERKVQKESREGIYYGGWWITWRFEDTSHKQCKERRGEEWK